MSHGASESIAGGLVQMHEAIDEGLYAGERRTPENGTPTHFHQWREDVFKPAFPR